MMIKFVISKEQRLHFEKFQFLELEGVLEPAFLQSYKKEILNRTQSSHLAGLLKSEDAFLAGRDLWRHGTFAKKFAFDKRWPEALSELTGERLIRLGYDQLLPPFDDEKSPLPLSAVSKYASFLQNKASLVDMSCIQGVAGGVILCLKSLEKTADMHYKNDTVFPIQEGNIVIVDASKEIDFSELQKRATQEFVLLTYANKRAVYLYNEKDVHLHAFKNLGYVFGDRLNDELNPVLFR